MVVPAVLFSIEVGWCLFFLPGNGLIPQERKLTGYSAQNSSGVHRCRHRVRFNEVPEKVAKVPEKVWEALVQRQVGFNRVPENVPVKVWEALVQSQVRFNRVPEKVPEKVWEALVQSQVRFNRVPKKVLRVFGAEPGQVQQGSGEDSGEGLGGFACRARSGSTGFRRRFRRTLVQSQVRVNKVLEKVPEKVPGGFGAEPGQVQQGSGEGSGEGLGGLACRARSGSTGFRRRFRRSSLEALGNLWCRTRSGSNRFNKVYSAWLRSTLQKDL